MKLRRYVENSDHAIRLKAEIMVDHFHAHVLALNKIGGKARAMVVTSSIERAIKYHFAIRDYLKERKSPYLDIVAFSGEPEYNGEKVTEAKLNGFPSRDIADKIQEDPYRFLVCADKFQTGCDEPLLHTMYVGKPLSGIKAVQTLSRLNRAHPQKHDVMVLDFANDPDVIQKSFEPYYRTTLAAGAARGRTAWRSQASPGWYGPAPTCRTTAAMGHPPGGRTPPRSPTYGARRMLPARRPAIGALPLGPADHKSSNGVGDEASARQSTVAQSSGPLPSVLPKSQLPCLGPPWPPAAARCVHLSLTVALSAGDVQDGHQNVPNVPQGR